MKRQMGLWACLALVPATLAGQTPPSGTASNGSGTVVRGEGADEGLRTGVTLTGERASNAFDRRVRDGRWPPELLRAGRVRCTSVDVNRLDRVMGHYGSAETTG
jgi:hypothetical protein